jgi:single-strand DNA-binding protein
MNKIVILGRLTKDPDVKYVASGKAVATFTMAVDRPFTGQDGKREADFIPVVIWGKTAELVGNSCAKGHRLLVEGRLQIRSYDGKDGNRHWVTEVIANNVEFVERKADSANRHIAPAGDMGAAPRAGAAKSDMSGLGTSVPFDEDVPF